ncbi:hypothetical protein [Rhodoferax ferrireducens]|uniref:hypothetical protein n=1 Tax=Rhodoferax ferrireducens TaxID=192843 RepID=UPI00140FF699|nr:hypothetical protein [Rhodoferax ferrireducens]
MKTMDATPQIPFIDTINTRYLETLLGYNARRDSLVGTAQSHHRWKHLHCDVPPYMTHPAASSLQQTGTKVHIFVCGTL